MTKSVVHEEIQQLLPWFINESLGEKERRRVLAHLQACQDCRYERDQLQRLQQAVHEDLDVAAGYRPAFGRLMDRIDAAESNRAATLGYDRSERGPRWAPYVGVAACLLIALLSVGVLNPPVESPAEAFTTLTKTPAADRATHRIAVTFEQPIKAETLRAALIETRSNIVSGPDGQGTYILEVTVPPDVTDREFIESMRAISGVEYAAFDRSFNP